MKTIKKLERAWSRLSPSAQERVNTFLDIMFLAGIFALFVMSFYAILISYL
jgi:hypothetical protein